MFKAGSKILIAYEDSDSFSAISRLDVIREDMPQIPKREKMDTVNFSEFWAEKSWGKAVAAATTADMIIVSLSGHMDLPVPVRRWMESWPNYEQASHITLVVVFGTEPADGIRQSVLFSYFQRIAENHGLDFLCNCDGAKNVPASPESLAESLAPAKPIEMPRAERYHAAGLLALPKTA
jgi:hypothetical protein